MDGWMDGWMELEGVLRRRRARDALARPRLTMNACRLPNCPPKEILIPRGILFSFSWHRTNPTRSFSPLPPLSCYVAVRGI